MPPPGFRRGIRKLQGGLLARVRSRDVVAQLRVTTVFFMDDMMNEYFFGNG